MSAGGPRIETLTISVSPSPSTNDDEVVLSSELGNLLARFDDGMIGVDPSKLLAEPCPLRPAQPPRTIVVGRCQCGDVGCGSVAVTITASGPLVTWTSDTRPSGVRFDAAQYAAELDRALAAYRGTPRLDPRG